MDLSSAQWCASMRLDLLSLGTYKVPDIRLQGDKARWPKLPSAPSMHWPAIERERVVWVDDLKGFGVPFTPPDARSILVKTRYRGGSIKMTIGSPMAPLPPPMPACAPPRSSPTRERERIPRGAIADAPTMIALGKRFLKEYVSTDCKSEHGRGIPPLSRAVHRIPGSAGTGCLIFRGAISRRSITICATRPIRPTVTIEGFVQDVQSGELWDLRPDGSNPCRHR